MAQQKLSRKFEENLKKRKKVFTHMNIWMIGKYSVKLHFQKKKKILTVTMEVITDADYVHAKIVCKRF